MTAPGLKPLFGWRQAITEPENGLTSTQRLVGLVLSLHMNERGGSCFPSHATVACEAGVSERAVWAALKALEEARFLSVDRRRTKGGRWSVKSYEATLPTERGAVIDQTPPEPGATGPPEPDDSQPPEPRSEEDVSQDLGRKPSEDAHLGAPRPSPADIVAWWNEELGDVLPKAQASNGNRGKHIQARGRIPERDERWWRDYFQLIRDTPFLLGESERGWKATIDWAVKSEDNVNKVLEGNYAGAPRRRGKTTVTEGFADLRRKMDDARRVGTDRDGAVRGVPPIRRFGSDSGDLLR